eukprot:CAMPEP_0175793570 /NCGR_PEP_ID=MMETSP0097-20121207/83532_1 /TAXON_ID=311494 /ORGANISM="Alexandrium monilatum, Strain CCMP3105" /LENGTH=51 /DNA_ID=CAMNT_0017104757 /DNA_START=163 /DNA_END=315 /DNA_ORIENTATION=+
MSPSASHIEVRGDPPVKGPSLTDNLLHGHRPQPRVRGQVARAVAPWLRHDR